jgi:hypothetical protein
MLARIENGMVFLARVLSDNTTPSCYCMKYAQGLFRMHLSVELNKEHGEPQSKEILPQLAHPSLSVGYRPDIDGLRAIAVISVMIFHAFPSLLHGGFVGVDVFLLFQAF